MKKLIALLLALGMLLSLTACGKGGTSGKVNEKGVVEGSNVSASGQADTDVYIDMWGSWANDNYRSVFLQEVADEFCKQYEEETGISVTFEYVGQGSYGALSEKLASGAATNILPVISQVEEQAFSRFYPLAADLSQYMKQEVLDDYLDGLMVSCTRDGKKLAVPSARSYVVAIVNTDLLTAAGHSVEELEDWTWEEYHQISKDISALGDDIYGSAVYWDEDAWIWESGLYSEGGAVDNEDGTKILFDTKTGTPIINLMIEMMKEGSAYSAYNEYGYTEITDATYPMFGSGKLGINIGSITQYSGCKLYRDESGNDFEILVAKQPAGAGGFSCVTGGSNMFITQQATETQKKVAAAFFEYLAQPENVAAWSAVSGYMASTKSVENDPSFLAECEKDPNLLNILHYVEDAHARPSTKHWQDMYSNVIIQDLVRLSQKPEDYDPAAVEAMVQGWAEKCQAIIDEGN